VQQPAGHDDRISSQASVTGRFGPSPPSPAPPMPHNTPPKQIGPALPGPSSSPPVPERNNMRNRVELDSVSPGIEKPNPLVSPITPSSPTGGHNFSYPARAPPAGVPRHVPSQEFNSQQSNDYMQQHQAPQQVGYGDRAHPAPLRPGHQPQTPHKQSTLANLKIAAAGIHVSSFSSYSVLFNILLGRWRSTPRYAQSNRRQALGEARFRCPCA